MVLNSGIVAQVRNFDPGAIGEAQGVAWSSLKGKTRQRPCAVLWRPLMHDARAAKSNRTLSHVDVGVCAFRVKAHA